MSLFSPWGVIKQSYILNNQLSIYVTLIRGRKELRLFRVKDSRWKIGVKSVELNVFQPTRQILLSNSHSRKQPAKQGTADAAADDVLPCQVEVFYGGTGAQEILVKTVGGVVYAI